MVPLARGPGCGFVLGHRGCGGRYQCKGLCCFSLIPLSWTVATSQAPSGQLGSLVHVTPARKEARNQPHLAAVPPPAGDTLRESDPTALSPERRSPRPLEGTDASSPWQSSGAQCLGADEGSSVFSQHFAESLRRRERKGGMGAPDSGRV